MDHNVYTRIREVAVEVPQGRQTVAELDALLRIAAEGLPVPDQPLQRLYGLQSRVIAPPDVYPSALAAAAARTALERAGCPVGDIDLLIYASVTADVEEPATAHIVADALGARCSAFDVKNACNAVISALDIADALIRRGSYRRVLIVSGEVLSRFTRRRIHDRADLTLALATFTGGDLGAAFLVEAASRPGILGSRFAADSSGWRAASVPNPFAQGGHDGRLAEARVDSAGLVASLERGPIKETATLFPDLDLDPDRVDFVCVHQPSVNLLHYLCRQFSVPRDKILPTVAEYGNVGSSSLPLQLSLAQQHGRLRRGDRVALIGAASGVSVGVMALQW
ncbi:3-oxoacyl-ACP synthase [Streptomyces longispororuber]|uniref:3-oxoacyl-ACP synthase n=1 Tax=Streptomyces longispororuber TaxID=68230 RepID=A0A919DHU7_9ACTN|nr:3-oxoacyl-[acyl-carrier-protein] synthase III C-terminal domain-containing protein [Streptomyces longispororuber]GHE43711.1 3-oxoacyl-ACP synthase [Streptomyces longispororuber]